MTDEIINTRRVKLTNGEIIPLEHQLKNGKFQPTREFTHYMKWAKELRQERTVESVWDHPLKYTDPPDTYSYSLDSCDNMVIDKNNNKTSQMLALDNIKGLPINVTKQQVMQNPGLAKYMSS